MKKKLKIFSIVLITVLLVGGGYLLYLFKFKEYDVADEEIDEIMDEPYEVELPDGSFILIDENGEVIEKEDSQSLTEKKEEEASTDLGQNNDSSSDNTASANEKEENNTTGTTGNRGSGTTKSTSSSKTPSNTDNPSKQTVAEIKSNYTQTFQNLEAQANAKINSLVARAKNEYNAKKANGESISYSYFYNKYMGAANSLEAQTDTVFYGTVGVVEKDLERHGYNKSYAQSFIEEYEATKKARRDSLLNKALGR